LYNTILSFSRNKFFYREISLSDTFETRLYLMFIHFSIIMIVYRKKRSKLDQKYYDFFFHNIEYNLRELGFGDVTVNKKMKEFNKILYDILLKIDKNKDSKDSFELSQNTITAYFENLKGNKNDEYSQLKAYFSNFYNFCFELPLNNMIRELKNFKN